MSEQNRIAFLCHPYHRGGVTRWMADAAIDYAAKGYETYFITLQPKLEFYSGRGRETMMQLLTKKPNKVKIARAKVGREFEFGTPAFNAHTYKQLLLQNVPAGTPLIISDDPTVWRSACELSATYPVVAVLHADEAPYYQLAAQYYKQVAIFVCVSARVAANVRAKSPQIDTERIFTIPCGIHLPAVQPAAANSNLLQLVYVGRITDYQKRSGDLAKVAELMKQKNIAFHLNIIGDGLETKVALQKKIIESGLEQQVTFTGWLSQDKVHEYLVSSDVLLLTSDFEGMPISMMEGLAAGCGFVGTRVSGIEDYEHHPLAGDCFGVFEPGDIATAVERIQKIGAVPVETRKSAARKLAEEQFSMEICLSRYNAAIATIPVQSYFKGTTHLPISIAVKSRITALLRGAKMSISKP